LPRAFAVFAQAKQMQPAAIINGERLYFCASNFISPSVSAALKMRRFSQGLSKAFQTCYYSSGSGWMDESENARRSLSLSVSLL
jgi:hypothetical protein